MFLVIKARKCLKYIVSAAGIAVIICVVFAISNRYPPMVPSMYVSEQVSEEIQQIFEKRNHAILEKNDQALKSLYDTNTKLGLWAYEHQVRKMKYLHNWCAKQGIRITEIRTKILIRYVKEKETKTTVNFIGSTEYEYVYEGESIPDFFRIGTYHILDIAKESRVITREWYTDPFADSLNLDNIKSDEITAYILAQSGRDFSSLNSRRKNAVAYADRYCGAAADEEYGYKYNKKYKDYNNLGGDCANFASQILYEGGKFRKTGTWKYEKDGSKAWVNAQAFKSYMLNSGRASLIAYGTYEKVYKASYKLLPGDFVAYEKKGKVTHISVVTGADSKGYSLVNCHNTDRYRVPWDLGWSDRGIKFWLVRVHF